MKDLSELRIYRLAVEIGEDVWKIVNSWEDSFAKWTIGKQWVDSSDSISANMMEGYYRNQKGDQKKFFQYALSSAKESELWLWKAMNRKLISSDEYDNIKQKITDLIPQTFNFIKLVQKLSSK
jgi:four helix bundle protein